MHNPKLPVVQTGKPGQQPYSEAVRRKVLAALRLGNTRNAAAGAAGIHRDTLFDWIRQEPDFAAQVAIAEDHAEAYYANSLRRAAGQRDVGAVKFWLERRRPAHWREKVQLLDPSPDLEDVLDEAMNDDELRAELARLAGDALRRAAPEPEPVAAKAKARRDPKRRAPKKRSAEPV